MKEFDFIKTLTNLKKFHLSDNDLGIGDDAASIGNWLIAKDLIVSDVHFKRTAGWRNILFKLITSNVSDIAAMGGKHPFYGLLGISTDGSMSLNDFSNVLKEVLDFYQIDLIGGDTTSSQSGIFLSFTIIGKRNSSLLTRSGAKPGDLLFLSRPVGLSKVSLERELNIKNHLIDPHLHYKQVAEVKLGGLLGTLSCVTSCIDISDGLGRDLSHISESSNVKIVVDEKLLHVKHLEKYNLDNPIDYVLTSGEEYALAFTIDRNHISKFENTISDYPNIHKIGYVSDGYGVFLEKENSELIDISKLGFEHL